MDRHDFCPIPNDRSSSKHSDLLEQFYSMEYGIRCRVHAPMEYWIHRKSTNYNSRRNLQRTSYWSGRLSFRNTTSHLYPRHLPRDRFFRQRHDRMHWKHGILTSGKPANRILRVEQRVFGKHLSYYKCRNGSYFIDLNE